MGQIITRLFDLFDFIKSLFWGPDFEFLEGQRNDQDDPREPPYRQELQRAEAEVDRRISQNKCPRALMEDFEVLGYLSGGSFGEVFKVLHLKTARNFALKVLRKSLFSKEALKKKVIFEKKLTYALQNAFVTELHYAFQDGESLFLVLELAPYGDFRNVVDRNPNTATTKLYTAQMVLALEYLHTCNIIYRDLKPQNIFVFEGSYIKIGDFGIAKKVTERTFTRVGTYPYMAPEMWGTAGFGKAVDWWALGIILYKLLYNEHPFDPPLKKQMIERIKHDELKFPVFLPAKSPIKNLLTGLLHKNPSKRIGRLVGNAVDVKRHAWFNDISFFDVLEKRIHLEMELEPKQPAPLHDHDIIRPGSDKTFNPGDFQGF